MPGVAFTHLDRMFWPEQGFRKRDLVEYYRAVAPVLVPHLRNRPVNTAAKTACDRLEVPRIGEEAERLCGRAADDLPAEEPPLPQRRPPRSW